MKMYRFVVDLLYDFVSFLLTEVKSKVIAVKYVTYRALYMFLTVWRVGGGWRGLAKETWGGGENEEGHKL